jgi:signal transduction histidine kinase
MPETLPLLRADADRLIQVLLNLLSNAAKFVPRGSGHIDVRLESDSTGVTIAVQCCLGVSDLGKCGKL